MTATACADRLVEGRRCQNARGSSLRRRAHHPAVAPPPGAAEEAVVGDAERRAWRAASSPIRYPPSWSARSAASCSSSGHQHLALLAQRAGEQRDVGALGDVARHRRAGADRLVVRVGVHEQQRGRREPASDDRRPRYRGRLDLGVVAGVRVADAAVLQQRLLVDALCLLASSVELVGELRAPGAEAAARRRVGRARHVAGRAGSACRSRSRRGSGSGIADSSACVYGCAGRSNSSSVGAISTILPRYITATRSEMCRTTDRSCAMNR